jgi:hypothetical protein
MRVPWRKEKPTVPVGSPSVGTGGRIGDGQRRGPIMSPHRPNRATYGVSSATHDHAAPPAFLRDSTPSGEFLDSERQIAVVLRRAGVEVVVTALAAAGGRLDRRRVDLGEFGWMPDLDRACREVGTADADGSVPDAGGPG